MKQWDPEINSRDIKREGELWFKQRDTKINRGNTNSEGAA